MNLHFDHCYWKLMENGECVDRTKSSERKYDCWKLMEPFDLMTLKSWKVGWRRNVFRSRKLDPDSQIVFSDERTLSSNWWWIKRKGRFQWWKSNENEKFRRPWFWPNLLLPFLPFSLSKRAYQIVFSYSSSISHLCTEEIQWSSSVQQVYPTNEVSRKQFITRLKGITNTERVERNKIDSLKFGN